MCDDKTRQAGRQVCRQVGRQADQAGRPGRQRQTRQADSIALNSSQLVLTVSAVLLLPHPECRAAVVLRHHPRRTPVWISRKCAKIVARNKLAMDRATRRSIRDEHRAKLLPRPVQ